MKKETQLILRVAGALLLAGIMLLAGCSFGSSGLGALPTLYVIPTLTPSLSPTLTLFLSPTATPSTTPTVTGTPLASATPLIGATSTPSGAAAAAAPAPAGSLQIQYFIPTPTSTSPGGSVTLAWAATGAQQATIFRVNADGSFGQSWQVDTTGTLTVTASSGTGTQDKYVLRVSDGVNIREADAVVSLSCNRSWFFTVSAPSTCPSSAALETFAAQQEFENGWMIWMQHNGKIYVLYDDGRTPAWEVYTDTWSTSEPEDDPGLVPPSSSLEQPVRGIGKVWRQNSSVKDRLGWAVDQEYGFDSIFQQEAGSNPNIYYVNLDDEVIHLASGGNSWRVVTTYTWPSTSP